MINYRLNALRKEMEKRNIDFYLIPTSDYHQTENVGKFFRAREYMSGFTGSEGTLLVSLDEARLWVDGRYFIQVEKEIKDTGIIKMEMGEPNVLSLTEYLQLNFKEHMKLGFFDRLINIQLYENLEEIVENKGGNLYTQEDLVDIIWENRPSLPKDMYTLLEENLSGKSTEEKVKDFINYCKLKGFDGYIVSQLDEIAWLMNIRGRDVEFFPVPMAYLIYYQDKIHLFIDRSKIGLKEKQILENKGINLYRYEDVYNFIENMNCKKIGLNKQTTNGAIYKCILGNIQIVDEQSPVERWKSIKNETEIKNTKIAHLKDGIAMTKFLYWLDQIEDKSTLTEYDISKKVVEFRRAQDGFICESFETIAGYKENGAIVHYNPDEKSSKKLDNNGLILIDSGAHYIYGTTDVTRTIALGDITTEEKNNFTLVLRGMIRLGMSKFLKGCNGKNLDILARGILWNEHLDYKHGTGHGVGHILNVHEGPIGIRWRSVSGINDMEIFEEGMIVSNEPGIYKKGEYGIRIENEMLVVGDRENEYGTFLKFDHLTLIPIDRECINEKIMEKNEILWLNTFHKRVYDMLEYYLTNEEREWLEKKTKPISFV